MTDKFAISAIAAGLAVIVAAFSVTFYSLTTDDRSARAQARATTNAKAPEDVLGVPFGASNQ